MSSILFGANNLSVLNIVANLITAFILALVLAVVYKKTHTGLSYSQSFLFTLILGGIAITAVMMVIGNSLARAFGAFGAFSIIRFRTAIKDTKDIAYIFIVLVIGMAVGTNNYIIALALTLLAIFIIFVLTKINFGSIRKYDYILNFFFDTKANSSEAYKIFFSRYLKTSNLIHIDAQAEGHILKLTFNVRFINDSESAKFLTELSAVSGVSSVDLINAKSDIEY